MQKKINAIHLALVACALTVALLIGGITLSNKYSNGVIVPENLISQRALEFYNKYRNVDDSEWVGVDILSGQSKANVLGAFDTHGDSRLYATKCFQVEIPFPHFGVVLREAQRTCRLSLSLGGNLVGHFVVKSEPYDGPLGNDSAVKLRKLRQEKYTPFSLPITNYDEYVAFKSDGQILVLLKDGSIKLTIAFSDMSDQTEQRINDRVIMSIIKSIKISDN